MKSEIGYCVWILYNKLWGKVTVDGKLKSQYWWKLKLHKEINLPTIKIENNLEGKPVEPIPIPFEIEFNIPTLNYETLICAWRKIKTA